MCAGAGGAVQGRYVPTAAGRCPTTLKLNSRDCASARPQLRALMEMGFR